VTGSAARYANGAAAAAVQAISPGSASQTSTSGLASRYQNGAALKAPVVVLVPKYYPPFGDVDCSNVVNSVDSLKILRQNAGLSVSQSEPCTDLLTLLALGELQGDVDCSNAVNSVDSLKILRFGAGLSVAQTQPCPLIGQ